MADAQSTVIVPRPISEVFAFLVEAENEKRWRPDVISIELVSGHGLGAVYSQTMRGPGGSVLTGDFRITRLDEPTAIAFEVIAGPVKPTGTFTLSDRGDGSTEVTFRLQVTPTGLMKMMSGMIDKQVQTEADSIRALPDAMASNATR